MKNTCLIICSVVAYVNSRRGYMHKSRSSAIMNYSSQISNSIFFLNLAPLIGWQCRANTKVALWIYLSYVTMDSSCSPCSLCQLRTFIEIVQLCLHFDTLLTYIVLNIWFQILLTNQGKKSHNPNGLTLQFTRTSTLIKQTLIRIRYRMSNTYVLLLSDFDAYLGAMNSVYVCCTKRLQQKQAHIKTNRTKKISVIFVSPSTYIILKSRMLLYIDLRANILPDGTTL